MLNGISPAHPKALPSNPKIPLYCNSSKDCAWNIPDEFFNIKLPKLKHVILCNSNQAYLDIVVLNTLSTLESLELVDFLTKGHIVNESDVEFFGEKFRARKGFEKLAHLRVDSNLLEFMITGAAKTLETLTVGFESLVDPFRLGIISLFYFYYLFNFSWIYKPVIWIGHILPGGPRSFEYRST